MLRIILVFDQVAGGTECDVVGAAGRERRLDLCPIYDLDQELDSMTQRLRGELFCRLAWRLNLIERRLA
jgi:hypothetical protein